jgi:hypothetical protein
MKNSLNPIEEDNQKKIEKSQKEYLMRSLDDSWNSEEQKKIIDICKKALNDDIVRASDDLRRAKNEFAWLSNEEMQEQYWQSGQTKQQLVDEYQQSYDEFNNADIFLNRLLQWEKILETEGKRYLEVIFRSISRSHSWAVDDLNRTRAEFMWLHRDNHIIELKAEKQTSKISDNKTVEDLKLQLEGKPSFGTIKKAVQGAAGELASKEFLDSPQQRHINSVIANYKLIRSMNPKILNKIINLTAKWQELKDEVGPDQIVIRNAQT